MRRGVFLAVVLVAGASLCGLSADKDVEIVFDIGDFLQILLGGQVESSDVICESCGDKVFGSQEYPGVTVTEGDGITVSASPPLLRPGATHIWYVGSFSSTLDVALAWDESSNDLDLQVASLWTGYAQSSTVGAGVLTEQVLNVAGGGFFNIWIVTVSYYSGVNPQSYFLLLDVP